LGGQRWREIAIRTGFHILWRTEVERDNV
jgi:hypothetical protein